MSYFELISGVRGKNMKIDIDKENWTVEVDSKIRDVFQCSNGDYFVIYNHYPITHGTKIDIDKINDFGTKIFDKFKIEVYVWYNGIDFPCIVGD